MSKIIGSSSKLSQESNCKINHKINNVFKIKCLHRHLIAVCNFSICNSRDDTYAKYTYLSHNLQLYREITSCNNIDIVSCHTAKTK